MRVQLVPAISYQTILLEENREEIFSSLLGKHHTRRRHNKLKKAGQVTLRRLLTKSETQQHLDYFFLHHIRRCALLGRQSTCAQSGFRQFLRAVVDAIDPSDRLRFEALELDGRPFAWHFSFLVNGKFLLYQHTFDLDSWDYAPGEVLLSNLLQFAQENVPREFDFGAGDEAYKGRFARHTRDTFSLYVEPRDLKGRLRGMFRAGQRYFYPVVSRLQQKAKAHTDTFRLLRSIRISISGLMSGTRQAKKDGTLLEYGRRWSARIFRKAVWGTEEVDVFPWETLAVPAETPVSESPSDHEVEIKAGRFGDLVDVAIERPDAVAAKDLGQFRQRLKKGDRIYIGRKSSQAVLLAWTTTSEEDGILTGDLTDAGTAARPTLSLYDSWIMPGLSDGAPCRYVLSVLKLEATSNKLDLAIRCGADEAIFRTELERQGFQPQCRIMRHRLLYWFRWTRVLYTQPTIVQPSLVRAIET